MADIHRAIRGAERAFEIECPRCEQSVPVAVPEGEGVECGACELEFVVMDGEAWYDEEDARCNGEASWEDEDEEDEALEDDADDGGVEGGEDDGTRTDECENLYEAELTCPRCGEEQTLAGRDGDLLACDGCGLEFEMADRALYFDEDELYEWDDAGEPKHRDDGDEEDEDDTGDDEQDEMEVTCPRCGEKQWLIGSDGDVFLCIDCELEFKLKKGNVYYDAAAFNDWEVRRRGLESKEPPKDHAAVPTAMS